MDLNSLGALRIFRLRCTVPDEPDPTFSGFSHTVPKRMPQYRGLITFQIGGVTATDGSKVYMDITGAVNDGWTLHNNYDNKRIPVGTGFTISAPAGPASSSTSFPIRFYTDSGGSSNQYLSKFAPGRAWAWASTYDGSLYPWPFDSRNFPGHTY